jgi:hypothetical protein
MGDSVDQTTFMFDYTALEPSDRDELLAKKESIYRVGQDATIQIGIELLEAQKLLAHHHQGTFVSWVKSEMPFSVAQAYNLMNVATAFPEFSNGWKTQIDTGALYALAAPSTPQEVRDEFVEKAEAGKHVTHDDVLTRIGKPRKTRTMPVSQPAPSIPVDHMSDADYEALPETSKEFIRQFSRIDVEGNAKSTALKVVSRAIDNYNDLRRVNIDDLREFTVKGSDLEKYLRELIDYNLRVVSLCRQVLPDDELKLRRLS